MSRAVRVALLAVAVAIALAVAAPAHALRAKVCCTSTIKLMRNDGTLVTKLRHGTYTIRVNDKSSMHNFHLKGYGVARATGLEFVGIRYWTVHFYKGHTYTYLCDAHPFTMRRTFAVT